MKKYLAILTAILFSGAIAVAGNIPYVTGPLPAADVSYALNSFIAYLNSNAFLQGLSDSNNPRNQLDNGTMVVQQRGTGAATCAQTGALSSAAYSADRWACDVNVTSGAGTLTVTTSSPTPPIGFAAQEQFIRNSGALAQPQCVFQEVPSKDVVTLQGQPVTFSFYAAALANMAADNGNVINAYIMYGTGTDQGFGSWTASPAITPAWTGINSSLTQAFTLTSSYARYQFSAALPTTATEAAVALCWTPTVGASGSATDGFVFTGAQLENGTVASPYEFKNYSFELMRAYRYFYRVTDSITGSTYPYALCQNTTTSATICFVQFPQTMRVSPTGSVSATTAFADTATAGSPTNCTGFAIVSSAATPYGGEVTCTTGATGIAGGAAQLVGASTATNAYMQWSADF